MNDVLILDAAEQVPLVSGDFFVRTEDFCMQGDIVDIRYRAEDRVGRKLWARLNDNLGLTINDGLWSATNPCEAVYRSDGLYVLSLRLSGNCLETVNRNTYPLGAFTCSMIHYAKGVRHVFRILPGEPLVEVCVTFHPSFFMKKYDMTMLEVEAFLNPPRHRNLDPWFNQCRMTPEMEAVIYALRNASLFRKTWRVFAEAKTLELVSLYLEQLEGQSSARQKLPITTSDLQRLHIVRRYLSRHYRQPLRIDNLCRLVGLNRRKLTEGFKSEFGRTVFGYIQYLRMEQARALFQNGFTDVNLVAKRVGYGHQSNFTKAFKKYLGVSPRQYMQAG